VCDMRQTLCMEAEVGQELERREVLF